MALALAGARARRAAARSPRRRERRIEIEIALAAYAVGVLGCTITAAAFGLGEAWLTVALAVHLPAIGWVEGRIRVPALRWVAFGDRGCRAGPPGAEPVRAGLSARRDADLQLDALRLWRAGGGVHRRDPAVRRQAATMRWSGCSKPAASCSRCCC